MAQTDVLEYLRKTPHNTNVNVVKTMLDNSGGGGAEPLIINIIDGEYGRFDMDKTFGEIRQAFDNGRTLLVAQDESYDDTTGKRMSTVSGCAYFVTGGEYPSASGEVRVGNDTYSVSCSEAPYTLEALDAQHPYMSD